MVLRISLFYVGKQLFQSPKLLIFHALWQKAEAS